MSEKIVTLNEEVIKGQIRELVRGSVEETLNELLEAEAEEGSEGKGQSRHCRASRDETERGGEEGGRRRRRNADLL